MAKSDYIHANDDSFNAQLQTFKNGIGAYSALLGLTAAQVTAQAADAAYFDYAIKCLNLMQGGAQQWMAWKNLARGGGLPPATGAPVATVLPAVVAAVALGIEPRFRALVQLIKANPNYNVALGDALSIEGTAATGPNLANLHPAIEAMLSGNTVIIKWGWGGYSAYLDLCELQVDRGTGGGFVMLAYDSTPGYTDTQPFPAAPAKWTYRAIYRVGDHQVGHWSNPVSVTVGG